MAHPVRYQAPRPRKRSWREAFELYRQNEDTRGIKRLLKLLAIRVAPAGFLITGADDVFDVIPGVDLLTLSDNVFWVIFAGLLVRLAFKVNKYRTPALSLDGQKPFGDVSCLQAPNVPEGTSINPWNYKRHYKNIHPPKAADRLQCIYIGGNMAQDTPNYANNYAKPVPLSWGEALQLYLHDPHAKKMLRRFAARFLPLATGIAIIDDFLLPVAGVVDDVALPFLIGGIVVMLYKINRYRWHPPAMKRVIDQ